MRDKFIMFPLIAFLFVWIVCSNVYGYTGSGTKSNPYVVSAESGLREILTELPVKTSWVYIMIDNNITLTKSIKVSGGKYRISAKGANRTIKRSYDGNAAVNKDNPQYCMRLTDNAQVVVGFDATNYTLRLGGNKGYFSGSNPSSGWFNVSSGSKLTIGVDAHLTNAVNNENEGYGSVIRALGNVEVNGEISQCQSANGGAIAVEGGDLVINSTAKIHDCRATTEGGAIFVISKGQLQMNGGKIYNCVSAQEGGAVFLGANSTGKIIAGEIYGNYAYATAGGVFSGYGALLHIGKTNSNGPHIYDNIAQGSGGGIRCNGGTGDNAGGTTYFYSGTIEGNQSGNVGGGISCGAAGNNNVSKLIIKDINFVSNTSNGAGGAAWLPQKVTGTATTDVKIENCYFTGNVADTDGGALALHGKTTITDVTIMNNQSRANGGGLFIGSNGVVHYKGDKILENVALNKGNGVYVKGQFQISNQGQVSSTNEVYLSKDTYIEVLGKVNADSFLNAVIESAVTTNGTKLVKVNYSGANSETELYNLGNATTEYNNGTIQKRYQCRNISSGQLLRAGKYAEGVGSEWIIISEEYKVIYKKNTSKNVTNMPSNQKKYWNEKITIRNNKIALNGYKINEDTHWNFLSDGTGAIVKPGSEYNINENRELYAQWIQIKVQELFMTVTDRYYVVGQNIALTPKELLKKVIVEDDLKTGAQYKVFVIDISDGEGNSIANGEAINTDNYIDTSEEKHYILKVKTKDETGEVTDEENINVYIMQSNFSENIVRFISADFIYTLNSKSKWNNSLKNVLSTSLNNVSNDSNMKIILTREKINDIKNLVKNNNYIISNTMNKELSESW